MALLIWEKTNGQRGSSEIGTCLAKRVSMYHFLATVVGGKTTINLL